MILRSHCIVCADELGLEPEIIQAVAQVESAKDINAFLFEPHIFSRLTQHIYDAKHPSISYPKWDKTKYPRTATARQAQFEAALKLDHEIAYQSASWGLFQIMGFNHRVCQYKTAFNMATDLKSGIEPNVSAFGRIVRSMGLIDNLRNHDWYRFAQVYNGPGFRLNSYDVKIAAAYSKLKNGNHQGHN